MTYKPKSIQMKYSLVTFSIFGILAFIINGCNTDGSIDQTIESSAFITRLGNDTLAVEVFSISEEEATASVLLRSPGTVIIEYNLVMDENGMLQSLDAVYKDPITDSVSGQDHLYRDGDSIRYEYEQRGQTRNGAVAADENILPFIDMVHWPFDIMTKRAYQHEGITEQPLISGSRVFSFELNKISPDSMTVKHPTRGTMGTMVNGQGEMVFLEASQTTRALTVERSENVDFDALAKKFAEQDKSGNSFGALSGRGETDVTVMGANILIDYGTPLKRGRDIWGSLVKYGKRWRTGANRATHFKTDKDLVFGDLEVPAGEYTLFTIPEEEGGILIINTQIGQNGQTYDETLDLGRVPLQFRDLDSVVEVFTITAEEEDGKGMLKLQWDEMELVTPFTVK